jgi:hypothetical protein
MKKFSIVVSVYQGCQTDFEINRFLESLYTQNYDNYELILVHDGEWLRDPFIEYENSFLKFPNDVEILVCNTEERCNVWGHTSRDVGLKLANGKYTIVTNADNIFYNVLSLLDKLTTEDYIYIGLVKMNGLHKLDNKWNYYDTPRRVEHHSYVDAKPLILGNYDCFCSIVPLEYWKSINYWHDNSYASDFVLINELSQKYRCKNIPVVIGEHT